MSVFNGELGLQFVTHLANHYTVPTLVRLAQLAVDRGFEQIWVNDNIRYRSQLVVLSAIASQVPIRLGTAIMVPYFHNPLDIADTLGALSELCEGREIAVAIARGALGQIRHEAEGCILNGSCIFMQKPICFPACEPHWRSVMNFSVYSNVKLRTTARRCGKWSRAHCEFI